MLRVALAMGIKDAIASETRLEWNQYHCTTPLYASPSPVNRAQLLSRTHKLLRAIEISDIFCCLLSGRIPVSLRDDTSRAPRVVVTHLNTCHDKSV